MSDTFFNEDSIIESAIELSPGAFNISESRIIFKFYLDGYTYFYTDGDKSVKIRSTYNEFLNWCRSDYSGLQG